MEAATEHRFDPRYRRYLWAGVFTQLGIFFLTSLTLDHGIASALALCVAAGYWPIALYIILRRRLTPTRWDIYYLKYGLIILFLAAVVILPPLIPRM